MVSKIKYRIDILKRLHPYSIGVRKLFITYIVVSVVETLLSFVLPIFYSVFIEKVILGKKINMLYSVILGYLIITSINVIIAFIKNYCRYSVNNHVTIKMKLKILENYLDLDFPKYEKLNSGNVKMILDDDIVKITDFTDIQSIQYFISIFQMLALLFFLFFMEWRLAIIFIAMLPISFVLQYLNGIKSQYFSNISRENHQKWSSWMLEIISGWREVRALNQEKNSLKKFVEFTDKYAACFRANNHYWVTRVLVIPKIKDQFLMQFALYFIGGVLIFYGQIKIGLLLVFAQYYSMLTNTIQNVTSADGSLQESKTYYDRVLLAVEETNSKKMKSYMSVNNLDLKFENVSFNYPEGKDVIRNLSFAIKPGERVGIVGDSGKGKSTLLKLIVGLIRPISGKIYFSNINIDSINVKDLHKRIGYVLQENMLFNTTIKDNLLYGNENASISDIKEACKKAFIKDFIEGLPDKYDTLIGENGIKLSGGQKQRLVLARLFLRDVDMFIFDEATSSLDQHAENIIQEVIENISYDKTIIIVAHRESSLSICDRIIYL